MTDLNKDEAKKIFFEKKKEFKMADSKKLRFSTPPILNISEISEIGPWVDRIN